MRLTKISQTGVGTTNTFPVNWRGGSGGFSIGLGAKVTGTATYTVEHCYDDVLGGETPTWYSHPVLVGQTANKDSSYTTPITAMRINVTAGTGTVVLSIVPAETSV